MPASATIITQLAAQRPPGQRWQPHIGEEAVMLMEHKKLPDGAGEEIQQKAASIIGRGQNPHGPDGQQTGLVVGYVQSGKTLSFTTVIALARDNQIPMVIVVAGTAENLFNQTIERLLEDLQVNAFDGPPRWQHFRNPDIGNGQTIQNTLDNWRNPNVAPAEKATLLLTVMKQHQRLNNLNELLAHLDLTGVPALVVDDEADQASLNTKVNRDEESTTYQRLLALREHLPHHTFLQYTATPQAPLLINIIDVLSPEFDEVLDPGDGYVGGIDFFGGNRQFTRVIPSNEVPSADNPITEPPESLLEALRVFFIGVSAGRPTWGRENPNRSMLVHPSRTTLEHFQYFQSILAIKDEWARILRLPERDADRVELVQAFADAYRNLAETVGQGLPPFTAILARLAEDIRQTEVREVNRRAGNRSRDINWRQAYAWILVGGQAMDRGFTVKELTVTYMPRGIGTGNADTLQQRARFFGYKRQYIGYCRIYLEAEVLGVFEGYVTHEEEMRAELRGIRDRGEPLASWKRRFILSDELNPCRASVIQQSILPLRGNYSDDWYFTHMLKMSDIVTRANRDACNAFCQSLKFIRDQTFTQPAQQHDMCDNVPLAQVIDDLLLQYRVEDPTDTERSLGMLLQVSRALTANADESARIYRMRPAFPDAKRSLDQHGKIPSIRRLLQGPTRSGGGYSYPGDFEFRDPDRITVQLHLINLTEDRAGNENVVLRSVPVVAVWIPNRMGLGWIVQDQASRT
jgi:Z1 domain